MIDTHECDLANTQPGAIQSNYSPFRFPASVALLSLLIFSQPASASLFTGEALDKAANIMALVVLVVAPIILITVFWLVHILPEKIAEKRNHPQAETIKVLCLLSLVFGGLLWPLAWILAYTKPVLYKLAYGRDTVQHGEEVVAAAPTRIEPTVPPETAVPVAVAGADADELNVIRERLAMLEARIAAASPGEGAV